MKKVIVGLSSVLVLAVLLAGVFYKQLWQLWEASIVTDNCIDYYSQVSNTPFKAIGVYDTDNNGYGTCAIYVNGARVDVVECSAEYFNFTDICKVKSGVMAGATPGDTQDSGDGQ